MIKDKSITLYSVAWGNQLDITKKVLVHCANIFPYFDKVILNDKINNLLDYNIHMIQELDKVIDTDFVLLVQADGYIINPKLWDNKFLDFDYIGAPWPWHNVVGNGGFSLRSKKFINTSAKLAYIKDHPEYDLCPEDNFLCLQKYNRSFFLNHGCRFADVLTGLRFSFEHSMPIHPTHTIKNSFGFHGKHNLT